MCILLEPPDPSKPNYDKKNIPRGMLNVIIKTPK